MNLVESPIGGAWIVDLDRRSDQRGSFARAWCAEEFAAVGIDFVPTQVNVSHSSVAGTMRGFHLQVPPHSEQKLVRCTAGAVFDVVVDLRPESPTYKGWYGVELSAASGRALLVPARCAHGYLTLTEQAELLYLVDQPYAGGAERGFRYDDASFGVHWPHAVTVVSDKDLAWPPFGQHAADVTELTV